MVAKEHFPDANERRHGGPAKNVAQWGASRGHTQLQKTSKGNRFHSTDYVIFLMDQL